MGNVDAYAGYKSGWLHSWQGLFESMGLCAFNETQRAWFAANSAQVVRVWNPEPFEATHAYHINGSVSGNFDIGVYSESGDRIVSTGAVAAVGISVTQFVAFPEATIIPSGVLLLVMAADSTGLFSMVPNVSTSVFISGQLDSLGRARFTSAMPLPTTLPTLLSMTQNVVPAPFGIVQRWP